MKQFSTLTLQLVFVLGAAHAVFADPLQWNLSTLTFSATSYPAGVVSTGTATGSFTFDADTNSYTTWSIELSGFPGTGVPASGLLLTPANTSINGFCTGCSEFSIYDPTALTPFRTLYWLFDQPLTDAGGTVSLATGLGLGLYLDNPSFGTFELQAPASVSAVPASSAVPEPSSAGLTLVIAIGFCGLFLHRRLRHSPPKS